MASLRIALVALLASAGLQVCLCGCGSGGGCAGDEMASANLLQMSESKNVKVKAHESSQPSGEATGLVGLRLLINATFQAAMAPAAEKERGAASDDFPYKIEDGICVAVEAEYKAACLPSCEFDCDQLLFCKLAGDPTMGSEAAPLCLRCKQYTKTATCGTVSEELTSESFLLAHLFDDMMIEIHRDCNDVPVGVHVDCSFLKKEGFSCPNLAKIGEACKSSSSR